MKRLLYILLPLLLLTAGKDARYERYIKEYSAIAVSEMKRSGVPASITLAQGLLESAAGQSVLAVKANNHFGIKCHSDWKGRRIYRDDDAAGECFRVYATAEASFRDHSDFLRYRDRYKSLFELEPGDYKGWARGLKKAGYATDAGYADKLIGLIEEYGLNRFDSDVPVPEAPLEVEKPVELVPAVSAKEVYRFSLSRTVYAVNGVKCIYAEDGDTYKSIADANDLFLSELLRFNDLSAAEPLRKGELVYLQAKKNSAAKGMEKYVVGEESVSLRDIAQRFGVRLSALKRMNAFKDDYQPSEGDTILLRRK